MKSVHDGRALRHRGVRRHPRCGGHATRGQARPDAEKDAHGNAQLSDTGALAELVRGDEIQLGIKRVRGDTFGYLQRSFAGCASDVDRREAREVGEFAVRQAIWGKGDGSVAIRRIGDYAVDYALMRLNKVAGETKVMSDQFIAPSGSDDCLLFGNICCLCWAAICHSPPACVVATSPRC